MTRTAIVLAKVFILVLMLGGLLTQAVMLPIAASQSAEQFPEVAYLQPPILALCILFVFCGQIVLGCVWMLLSLARRDSIFSGRAFGYVDVMIGALVVAAAVVIVVLLIIGFAAGSGTPGLVYPGIGASLGCVALALVLVVMRGLLVKASVQESYLAEVV